MISTQLKLTRNGKTIRILPRARRKTGLQKKTNMTEMIEPVEKDLNIIKNFKKM